MRANRMRRGGLPVNLLLNQSDAHTGWIDTAVTASLASVAADLRPDDGLLGLVVVGDEKIREINREFRGIDAATDVISFSYLDDDAPRVHDDDLVGEIYLSRDTLERDAERLGVDRRDLFLRLGIHGMLHVIGFDHETEPEALEMENRERDVLAGHLAPDVLARLF